MVRVVVFGHSMPKWLRNSGIAARRAHPGLEYIFIAFGGLTWEKINCGRYGDLKVKIKSANPHVVCIHMGTNDLCSPGISATNCYDSLERFTAELRTVISGDTPIVIIPCTYRTTNQSFRPGQVNTSEFISKVDSYNKLCARLSVEIPHTYFLEWHKKHRPYNFLERDGLHLSLRGNVSLFFALQRCILRILC